MRKRKERAFNVSSPLTFIGTQIERLVRWALLIAERLGGNEKKMVAVSSMGNDGDTPYASALRDLLENGRLDTANKIKLRNLIETANDPEVCRLLKECDVDPKVFRSGAFYVTEKCVKFAFLLTRDVLDMPAFNEVAFAAIKTILNCHEAREYLWKSDIEAAILKHCNPDKGREKFVHQKRVRIGADVQVQQALAMGVTLGYLRKEARKVYAILPNAFLNLAHRKLAKVTMT